MSNLHHEVVARLKAQVRARYYRELLAQAAARDHFDENGDLLEGDSNAILEKLREQVGRWGAEGFVQGWWCGASSSSSRRRGQAGGKKQQYPLRFTPMFFCF